MRGLTRSTRLVLWRAAAATAFFASLDVSTAAAQPVGPDFKVNTSTSADYPSPAVAPDGSFVIAFTGPANQVMGRRFTSNAQPLTNDFRLGDGTEAERTARVAPTPDGGFIAAWAQGADFNVFARRFAANGAPLTASFRVNTTTAGNQYAPAVAVAPGGTFLVVWTDASDGSGAGIFAQRYSAGGVRLGGEFRVNTTTLGDQLRPSVSVDGQGGFVAAWMGGQNGTWDIFVQKLAASGTPVGGEVQANSFASSDQLDAQTAADASGNFLVVWSTFGVGLYVQSFAQRFTASAAKVGTEFLVSSSTTPRHAVNGVFMDGRGRFVVSYGVSFDATPPQPYEYREFAADATPKGEGRVDMNFLPQPNRSGSAAGNASGAGVVTWRGTGHVYARRFALSPDPIGAEFRVNTTTTQLQGYPAVASNANGSFVVAWQGERPGYSNVFDIYAQRFAASGTAAGGEILSSSYFFLANNRDPSVAVAASGAYVVAWALDSINGSVPMVRRFDASGTPLHDGGLVTETGTTVERVDVDCTPAGAFVVVWNAVDPVTLTTEILGQRFASSGAPLGARFQVNTYTPGNQEPPRLALDATGNFVVVWASPGEDGNGKAVMGRRYAASGAPLGAVFLVNGFTIGDQNDPGVGVGADGAFVVVWRSPEDGYGTGVVAQRFAATGAPAGAPFLVNTFTSGGVSRPRVAVREDGFVVAWRSDYGDHFVKAQQFTKSASRIGTEFQIGRAMDPSEFGFPAIAFTGPDVVVAWTGDPPAAPFDDQGEVEAQRLRIRLCTAGDANGDGAVNVSDVLFLINHLFAGGPVPTSCGNVNGDATTNVSDVLYLINHLFAGGPIPI